MIFSSLLFLFWFLPIFFFIYYIVPFKAKNVVLLLGSMIFYSWGEPKYMLLLILSILVNYFAGILIGKSRDNSFASKSILVLAIIYNLGTLVFFKYINFIIDNINSAAGTSIDNVDITLPLGISFYTFQIMSYVIDLYRGKVKCEKSIINLGTYLCMFPQLIAGPIVVYSDVSKALYDRKITLAGAEEGIKIFILGLGAKVLIANNVGMLWDEIKAIGYSNISMPLAWLGAIAYTLQIFFDFNGYSLMAIGLGKLLGFEFPQNFNYPYIADSITDFWRRWHITLSSWFREYVYIPLGGNRKGKSRTYLNLLIVWGLTGLWHGANWNFLIWGLFFFMILSIEKMGLNKVLDKSKVISHIYTLVIVIISWVIFAITDFTELAMYFKAMFGVSFGSDIIYYGRNYGLIILIGCILSTPLLSVIYGKIKNKPLGVVFHLIILILSVAYLTDASYNPFLYFRF